MPQIRTAYFGELDYSDGTVFQFPNGLPGFEQEHAFLFLQQPHTQPLLFLQSLTNSRLCFILLPILVLDPGYAVSLEPDDVTALRLAPGRPPVIGEDILCAAIVRPGGGEDGEPTANLMAPVVVNLKEQIGLQIIQSGSPYSYRHPIPLGKEVASCS
ncbi:MAG TPA: flagellar assembly protein FliW [Bryobacteraceae bacterium]|jgi:flagellar assembly factor FliW|nr:flagellar assembly protein FliW [Bryobacteraceae bacterium]